MYCRLAVALILLPLIGGSSARGTEVPESPISLQDLKDGLASRQQRYSDGHYTFVETGFFLSAPEKLTSVYNYNFFKSGTKILFTRIPTLPDTKFGIDHAGWNNLIRTGYTERPNAKPDMRYSGTLLGRLDHIMYGKWAEIIHEEMYEAQLPVADAVQKGEWELMGQKMFGSYRAWGLRSKGIFGGLDENVEIWTVPLCDFAPVQITEIIHIKHGKDTRTELGDVELGKLDGRWMIRHARLLTVNPNVSSEEYAETFDLKEYIASVPDDMNFIVKFPVGTHVFDERKNLGFVAGKYAEVLQGEGLMRRLAIQLVPEYNELTDYGSGLSDAEYKTTKWSRFAPAMTLRREDYIERPRLASQEPRWWLWAMNTVAVAFLGWLYVRTKRRPA